MKKNNILIPDFLKGTYKEYGNYTKHYAKSFYFASHVLPFEKRNSAFAVYAFCRFADNITDVSANESSEYLQARIKFLLHTLDEVYRQVANDSENVSDFVKTIKKFGIPKNYFSELIEGVASDFYKKKYETYEELDIYCYKVASVVGLIMTKIFGSDNPESYARAVELGKAMQLTNIIRDISDDFSIGRIYIPQEDLKRFGYTELDIENKVIDRRFISLMKFQIERARNLYKRAEKGISMITDDGSRFSVKMMSRIYSGILDEIEKNNYDIFTKRHYVSLRKKLGMAFSVFVSRFIKRKSEVENDSGETPVFSSAD